MIQSVVRVVSTHCPPKSCKKDLLGNSFMKITFFNRHTNPLSQCPGIFNDQKINYDVLRNFYPLKKHSGKFYFQGHYLSAGFQLIFSAFYFSY
jgi:hypothetical protein